MHAGLRSHAERVRTLNHIEIEHIMSIDDAEIDGFLGLVRQSGKDRPPNLAQSGVESDSGAEPCEFWTNDVGTGHVAEKIAFLFEMRDETIGGAFVDASLLRDFAELQAVRRSIEGFEDPQNFSDDTDRRGFGFAGTNHRPLPSLERFTIFDVQRRTSKRRRMKKCVPHAETPKFTIQNTNFQY